MSMTNNHPRGAAVSDPVDETSLTSDELGTISRFGHSVQSLGPVTASDESDSVSVTLDKDGRIGAVAVTGRWTSHYSAASLVGGIIDAATAAGVARFEKFGETFADESIETPRMPAPLLHETIAGQLAEITDRGAADHADATMEHIGNVLRELTASIESVTAEVEAFSSREFSGRSASGHARAAVSGNGTLIDLRLDQTWLDRAHPTNVGREATQAIHAAYQKIAGQDVGRIIAASVIGKLDRLSKDPVALAQEFGLRS